MNANKMRQRAQEVKDQKEADRSALKAAAAQLAEDRYQEYKQINQTAFKADLEARIEKAASRGEFKIEVTESYKGTDDWDHRSRLLEETVHEFKREGFEVQTGRRENWDKRVSAIISWE